MHTDWGPRKPYYAYYRSPGDWRFPPPEPWIGSTASPPRRASGTLRSPNHKAFEKGLHLDVGVDREHVGDELIWADDDHAAFVAIYASRIEDVWTNLVIGAEDLLIVDE